MNQFNEIKNYPKQTFLRYVGISLENFLYLFDKIKAHIQEIENNNPLKKRGRKSSLSLEDTLLLTLTYLRDYPTFLNLGQHFGISESYAWKIYQRTCYLLLKVLDMSNPKELLNKDLNTIIIDVSEQPIERPKKKQKSYFSGKKKPYY